MENESDLRASSSCGHFLLPASEDNRVKWIIPDLCMIVENLYEKQIKNHSLITKIPSESQNIFAAIKIFQVKKNLLVFILLCIISTTYAQEKEKDANAKINYPQYKHQQPA
jgi:hypothetical protein